MAKKFMIVPAAAVLFVGGATFSVVRATDSRKAAAVVPEVDPAEQAEIARLVRELGAPTFMVRQHAQRVLVGFGLKAKSALEAACHDPDQEIERRAKAALAAIDDVDFHVRLGAFLADEDADNNHGLAGWKRYRSLVGSSVAARRLFADMQRAERELLEAVDRSPAQSGGLLDARCQQLESATQGGDADRQPPLSLGAMAALVFTASNTDVPVSGHAGNCLNNFGNQTSLTQALHARPTSAIIRSLLGTWVSRPFEHESVTAYRNLLMAMQYNLKEAVPAALALIEPPGGPPHLEQYAVLAIGKLGGREHVPALVPLLKDERPIGVPDRTGRESDTQVRDVALAAMIHLTGQKLADYGFVHAKSNTVILFNSNTLGFNDPTARSEALKKWQAWWEKQPKARPRPAA